jgi:FdhD protein
MSMLDLDLGWPAYRVIPVQRWQDGRIEAKEDAVAEEAPVALMYNGEPHVVMLATPLDLEDFALGFSLTEHIVSSVQEIETIRVFQRSEGIEVRVRIPEIRCESLEDKGRNMTGRTGCGLCGAATLKQAIRHPSPVVSNVSVTLVDLLKALNALHLHQRINQLTGAVHAAAWITPGQSDILVREDVGRHNALDKLIGCLARQGTDFSQGLVVVTSRASFEMVQKCAMVGIGMLVAISAPTGLAVRLAHESQMTLIGFARDSSHVIYSHPERMVYL